MVAWRVGVGLWERRENTQRVLRDRLGQIDWRWLHLGTPRRGDPAKATRSARIWTLAFKVYGFVV